MSRKKRSDPSESSDRPARKRSPRREKAEPQPPPSTMRLAFSEMVNTSPCWKFNVLAAPRLSASRISPDGPADIITPLTELGVSYAPPAALKAETSPPRNNDLLPQHQHH